jgi:hypothetical protein
MNIILSILNYRQLTWTNPFEILKVCLKENNKIHLNLKYSKMSTSGVTFLINIFYQIWKRGKPLNNCIEFKKHWCVTKHLWCHQSCISTWCDCCYTDLMVGQIVNPGQPWVCGNAWLPSHTVDVLKDGRKWHLKDLERKSLLNGQKTSFVAHKSCCEYKNKNKECMLLFWFQ